MESGNSNGVSLLQEANDAQCPTAMRQKVREWCSFINDIDELLCFEHMNSEPFNMELKKLLSHVSIPEFTDRDFTSYDRSDFKDYDISAHALLEFAIKVISLSKIQVQGNIPIPSEKQIISHPNPSSQGLGGGYVKPLVNEIEIESQNILSKFPIVLRILPDLLLLIGGNIHNPVWSSQDCRALSGHLLKNITDLFGQNIHNILVTSLFLKVQIEIPKWTENNILGYLFHMMEKPLSRMRWEKNPFLCEVFCWLVLQVNSPNLSNHIDQVMATSLNFIHSHVTAHKVNGLLCLKHLLENVSGEELRWYNRADVIYEAVRNQMYSKEEKVLDIVLQCVFFILKILERSPLEKSDKHHEIMSNLLRDTEMENLLVIRRILISNLASYILDCGVLCIQHLSRILRVIETYLDVEDSPQEVARVQALQALENIIIVAWPRMYQYSQNILQFLLKLMINIESPNFREAKNASIRIKDELVSKATVCVTLLVKINPELHSCVVEVQESNNLVMLKDFSSKILEEA